MENPTGMIKCSMRWPKDLIPNGELYGIRSKYGPRTQKGGVIDWGYSRTSSSLYPLTDRNLRPGKIELDRTVTIISIWSGVELCTFRLVDRTLTSWLSGFSTETVHFLFVQTELSWKKEQRKETRNRFGTNENRTKRQKFYSCLTLFSDKKFIKNSLSSDITFYRRCFRGLYFYYG